MTSDTGIAARAAGVACRLVALGVAGVAGRLITLRLRTCLLIAERLASVTCCLIALCLHTGSLVALGLGACSLAALCLAGRTGDAGSARGVTGAGASNAGVTRTSVALRAAGIAGAPGYVAYLRLWRNCRGQCSTQLHIKVEFVRRFVGRMNLGYRLRRLDAGIRLYENLGSAQTAERRSISRELF
jgi:hypothetical protein